MSREVSTAVQKFEMRPEVYPMRTSGVISDTDPLYAQESYYNSEVEFREFAENLGTHYPIEGLVPLALSDIFIQHLPSFPLAVVKAKREVAIRKGYAGRVCDITINTSRGVQENYSLINTAVGPGEVYKATRNFHAEQKGTFSPYRGMNYAIAWAQENPELPHPMADQDPDAYDERYDYEVFDVMTAKDVNPQNVYVDTMLPQKDEADYPILNMLSEVVKEFSPDAAARYETKKYENGVDQVIAGFGLIYKDIMTLQPGQKVKFDELIKKRLMGFKDGAAIEIRNEWVKLLGKDLSALRAACKAAVMYEHLRKEKEIHKRSGRATRQLIEAEKAYVRKEFVQPLLMASAQSVLRGKLRHLSNEDRNIDLPDPFRYSITAIDKWDIDFARKIGSKLTGVNFADQAAKIARQYRGVKADTRLIMEPRPEVVLSRNISMKRSENSLIDRGRMHVRDGEVMGASAPDGAFYEETVESFYNERVPLMMDGIMGRWTLTGPGMEREREHVAINLLSAPGVLLRVFDKMGVFNNASQGMPGRYSKILDRPTRMDAVVRNTANDIQQRSLVHLLGRCAGELDSHFALVKWRESDEGTKPGDKKRGFDVIGILENGDAFEVVANNSGARVRINPAKVLTNNEARKARVKENGRRAEKVPSSEVATRKGMMNVFSRTEPAGRFEVVGEPVGRNEEVIGKFAILGSTVHIGLAADHKHAAKVMVMRSESRVDSEALQAEDMDEELLRDE